MSAKPELDAMGTVLSALEPLDEAAQTRVIRWVAEKLQLGLAVARAIGPMPGALLPQGSLATEFEPGLPQLPPSVTSWLKQNALTATELETVFHFDGDETAVIAAQVPGKSNREKTLNCYVLAGVLEFLRTGTPSFGDKRARGLCETFGCFDATNHAKYINDKGNEFTGAKDKGWTLTAPGKKRCAILVKEIASSAS